MKLLRRVVLSFILLLVSCLGIVAEDVRIFTPYGGLVGNQYSNKDQALDLDDTGAMGGLFFQWVSPDLYQWNVFLYHAPDVNYSALWGGHIIFDVYLGVRDTGKWSIGGGAEIIRLDMDAGDSITPLTDFELLNTVYVPFLRAGRYFYLDLPPVRVTLKPWVGAQAELVRGELGFVPVPPAPPIRVEEKIDESEYFPIAGLSVITNLSYYAELQTTYKATFNCQRYLNTFSGMLNVFFSRRFGLSYKMMYVETTTGSTIFHLLGTAVVF